MMFKVRHYSITPSAFPSYKYVCGRVPQLHKRYTELLEEIGVNERIKQQTFGSVDVFLIDKLNDPVTVQIEELFTKRSLIQQKGIKFAEENLHFKSLNQIQSTCIAPIIIPEDLKDTEDGLVLERFKPKLFVIKEFESPKPFCDGIVFTTKEQVVDDISDELEKEVLKSIKTKCENVKMLLDKKKFLEKNEHYKNNHRENIEPCQNDDNEMHIDIDENGMERESDKSGSRREKCFQGDNQRTETNNLGAYQAERGTYEEFGPNKNRNDIIGEDKKLDINKLDDDKLNNLREIDIDKIECLYAEMITLFRTSSVPNDQQPNIGDNGEVQIDAELRAKLISISPAIKGIGYRFGRFVIFVEGVKSDFYDSNRGCIESVLADHGVEDYTLEEVSTELKPYRCDVKVGAKIETDGPHSVCGTLGCFASMLENNRQHKCALTAKHIASHGNHFLWRDNGLDVGRPLGNVVDRTVTETGLDIAALKLNGEIRFCAKFRTELDSDLLQCKVYNYLDDNNSGILSCGQLVYIWGATSKPGKGVITVPRFQTDGMEEGLILIEDRYVSQGETQERFCQPGDSGAVVCVEDRRGKCVHVLAMVMGILNSHVVEQNPAMRGKYLSVPLSTGLQELRKRTGHTFHLCECI